MLITANFISGCMLGIEFVWDRHAALIDLFIVRIVFEWGEPE